MASPGACSTKVDSPLTPGTRKLVELHLRCEREPHGLEFMIALVPFGGFDDLVQDRLQPGRTNNGVEDAADRTLLFTEVFELAREEVGAGRPQETGTTAIRSRSPPAWRPSPPVKRP